VAAESPTVTLDRVYVPERSMRAQMIAGGPREAAERLVEKLRFEARVL
jgi:electron transfer flavoprotein beta subunit